MSKEGSEVSGSFRSTSVKKVYQAVRSVFEGLDEYPFLGEAERGEFGRFYRFIVQCLEKIDERMMEGGMKALDMRDFPLRDPFHGGPIRVGLLIGSFDPFQMAHLAMALRFLASGGGDCVFVVPEGARNDLKPLMLDYGYRYSLLSMQLKSVFAPLIAPLDIGKRADTIDIVRNFIRMWPNRELRVTHILGSDSLERFFGLLPDDIDIWARYARESNVDFRYGIFVIRRGRRKIDEKLLELVRGLGIEAEAEQSPIKAPSSTEFRKNRLFTIVFPSAPIMKHLEFVFRYDINRSWKSSGPAP